MGGSCCEFVSRLDDGRSEVVGRVKATCSFEDLYNHISAVYGSNIVSARQRQYTWTNFVLLPMPGLTGSWPLEETRKELGCRWNRVC